MPAIWTDIQEAASVVALIGVPYLMIDKRRRLPRIAFDRGGYHRQAFEKDGVAYGRITFTGTIQNKSLDANTVEKVFLLVWRTKRKVSTRRYGYGGVQVIDGEENVIGPPFELPARSSLKVKIVCEFTLVGSLDGKLFTETKSIPIGNTISLFPKYEYELAFEDIEGNLFDRSGFPLSRKSIDLRWTIDSAWERFKDGKPLPLIKHVIWIAREEIRFAWTKVLRFIGL